MPGWERLATFPMPGQGSGRAGHDKSPNETYLENRFGSLPELLRHPWGQLAHDFGPHAMDHVTVPHASQSMFICSHVYYDAGGTTIVIHSVIIQSG